MTDKSTVVFCWLIVWLSVEGRKEKSDRKRKWKLNVEIFTLIDVKMILIWTFLADPCTELFLSE